MAMRPAEGTRLFRLWPGSAWTVVLVCFLVGPAGAKAQGVSVLSTLSTEGRSLTLGEEASGALSSADSRAPDDSPLEAWTFEARAGQRVTIDLRSADFDAYLYLVGPGFDETLNDDDGGGGCDARLEVTFLETGRFTVVASSRAGSTGPYRLAVSADSEPAAPYACGGVNPAVLLGLPIDGRALELRGIARGSFDGSEATIQDGRPAVAWALNGRAGESVTVRLISDDFDGFLHLLGPGMAEAASDDDSAGNLDAEITLTFPETGTYRAVASALSAGARGSYTLETVEPLDVAELPTGDRAAMVGETVSGFLATSELPVIDGRPGQAWALEGVSGQSLTIDLLSDAFDGYLYLAGPGLDVPLEDDDGGTDRNARITVTIPASGTFRVIVSAFSAGSGGAFDLRVTPN